MEQKSSNSIEFNTIKRQLSSGFLDIFVSKNKKNPDKQLAIFIEIEASDKDNEIIVNELKNELEYQFFNSPTENNEYAFESALAKANAKIKDILLSKPRNWLNKIHIAALAICYDEIYIAPVGDMHAFLVSGQKTTDVLYTPKKSSPSPIKLFTNIVSGSIIPGNSIIITNESVLDYISEDRIRKCSQDSAPVEIIEKITELLVKAPENKQFGVIAVKKQEKKEEIVPIESKKQTKITEEKVDIIFELENKPNEKIKQENSIINLEYGNKKEEKIKEMINAAKPYLQEAVSYILSGLLFALEKTQNIFSKLPSVFSNTWRFVLISWKNQRARDFYLQKTKDKSKKILQNILNLKNKKQGIIGFGIFIIILALATNVAIKSRAEKHEEIKAITSSQEEEIKNKISEAEAALIYDNFSGAKTLLLESEKMLENFPQDEKYSELKSKIDSLKAKSEKKRIVENADLEINLDTPIVSKKDAGLLKTKTGVLFFDGVQHKFAKIDEDKKTLNKLEINSDEMESFSLASVFPDESIIAIKQNSTILIDQKSLSIKKQTFEFSSSYSQKTASYSNNIYAFDKDKNTITKFSKTSDGLTYGQKWIEQDYALATMQDIAVDGYVYLIDSQGAIHEFLKGKFSKRIPWPIEQKPGSEISFYTDDQTDYFYILDAENKKIVIMNKNGTLKEQIEFSGLKNASDITVFGPKNDIYALSEDKIYKLSSQ